MRPSVLIISALLAFSCTLSFQTEEILPEPEKEAEYTEKDTLDYIDSLTDDEALMIIYEGFPEEVKRAFGGKWTLENIHANALPVIYWASGKVRWYEVDGPLPEEIGAFDALTEIRANGDPSSKYSVYEPVPFPESISKCRVLRHLTVKNQPVTGPIPEALRDLPDLQSVTLTGLDLEGPVPSWCSRFEVFSIGGNRLSGAVPKEVVKTRNWEIRGERNLIQQEGFYLFEEQ